MESLVLCLEGTIWLKINYSEVCLQLLIKVEQFF